jgi:PAS domain S-box-containing protein
VYEDSAGIAWLGTDKGLNRFDRKSRTFRLYAPEAGNPRSLSNEYVFAICEDRSGSFWVGTWGGGLNKMDRSSGTFKHYLPSPGTPGSLSHDVVRVIYEDREGCIWIGTEGGGLNRFDRQREWFTHFKVIPGDPGSLSNNYISSITEDTKGRLWIGTNEGLNRYDRQGRSFVRYMANPGNPGSLSVSSIASIHASASGIMWIGTFGGGLNRYDPRSRRFTAYRKKDGLPNDVIYGILEDDEGNLWLSTNNGLSRFNPRRNTYHNYYEQDGLQSNEFNQGSYYKCRSGEMIFGGINGFNLFDPFNIMRNPHVPPILVTDFQVFNQSIPIGADSLLKKSITETTEIRLSHRHYVFSFQFVALDYFYPRANLYAYMMEGLDRDWNYVGTRRFATYTTLPPGNYTFRVKGSNNDGVWNDRGTAIRVIITPPYWQTWWFRGAVVFFLVLCVIVFIRVRTHNIRKRNIQLQEMNIKLNREVMVRRQAEENLKKSERRIRTFLQTASEGFMELKIGGTIVDANPEMCSILGRPKEDIQGTSIYDFVDADGEEIIREQMQLRKQGTRSSYELTMLQPEGTEVHCVVNAAPIWDEEKKVRGSFALITDITDIIEAEEELKRTRNYLNDVFNSLSSMLISIDTQGRITQWNKAAETYFRIKSRNSADKKVWDVVPFLKPYRPYLIDVIENGRPVELHKESIMLLRREKKYLDIFMYPLAHSGLEGVVIRMDDVTEMEQKDRQLIQAQKMEIVGNLAGGLAHDFNNVLGGIVGTTSLLQFLLEDEEEIDLENIKGRVETIERGAERAADLVKQLLTLSRKNEPLFAPADLNQALKHVIKICENTFDKSIKLDISYYEGRAVIWADATQVEQVMLNLCINAAHSMTIMRKSDEPQGGTISISITSVYPDDLFRFKHPEATEGSYWVLEVSDSGVGIDSGTITKIFDPFFTTKSEQKGTGLGLAMAYHIIQQHKGFLEVHSELGQGTTFKIFLPQIERIEDYSEELKQQEQLTRGSGLILVVDDEKNLRETSREILTSCGYDVILAENGVHGVEVFSKKYRDIDMVLLDMVMPNMSGKDAYIEMKKIYPNVKVLLTSGFKQDERVKKVLELGVNGFIQKPYSIFDLSRKISEIITT